VVWICGSSCVLEAWDEGSVGDERRSSGFILCSFLMVVGRWERWVLL
jgi:hypothetical protein